MTDQTSDGTAAGGLLAAGPRMVLVTNGFAIYPTLSGIAGHSCDGVAFPNVALLPHRPLLAFPTQCVEGFYGSLQVVSDRSLITFDLSGYAASFEGVSGMSRVVDLESTRPGNFDPFDPERGDFNLLPDTHSFFRGLRLPHEWRTRTALQSSFTFLPGEIGAYADGLTRKYKSNWGFTIEEQAKIRRKTNLTMHLSDGLPSRTITLQSLRGGADGTIRVKPAAFGLVVGLLTNAWVDERGEYVDRDPQLVNLSHVQAMLDFCERSAGTPQVDFGTKTVAGVEADVFAAVSRALPPDLLKPFAERIDRLAPLYNSDVNCSGRRMTMT